MKKLSLLMLFIFLVPFISFAAFPVDYQESLDITTQDKSFTLKSNTVKVSATRPMKPMNEFTLTYSFDKPNVKSIKFTSNMEMNMGKYEYESTKTSDKVFTVKQILVKCMSGRTKWYTKADITYTDGKTETMYVFFDVK